MGYQVETKASRSYACGYYCHHCGNFNVEAGTITETAVTPTAGEPTAADRQKNVEKARLALDSRYARLRSQVNSFQEFDLLAVPGCCAGCGKKQVWAEKPEGKKRSPVSAALACLAFAAGILGALLWKRLRLVFAGALLALMCLWWGARWVARKNEQLVQEHNRRSGEVLRAVAGQNCFPYVAAAGDPVRSGDSRSEGLQEVLDRSRKGEKG